MIDNIKGFKKLKRTLSPKLVKKAEPRAINKVAQMSRTAESKEIRKTYNVKAKRLNRELEKVSGDNRATSNKPRAIIRAKKLGKGNPGLQNYGAKQTNKGVSYRIRKDSGRKTRPNAFIAVMPKGGSGVFIRSGNKKIMTRGLYIGKERETIIRQVGPSIVQMMERVGIGPIKVTVSNNFLRLFMHEYSREIIKSRR